MAIKAFQPNLNPIGHFDVLDTDLAGLKGGEVLVFDQLEDGVTDQSAPDVFKGTPNNRSLLRLSTTLDTGPFFLAGNEEEVSFTTPGFELTSLFAQNKQFGQTLDSSNKVAIIAEEGFYSVSSDVVDSTTVNATTDIYTRLYPDASGQLTATPSVGGAIVGFFIEFQNGEQLRGFPDKFRFPAAHRTGDSVVFYKTNADGYLNLELVSQMIGQTGQLGLPSDGYFGDGYYVFNNTTTIADAVDDLNQGLGDITSGITSTTIGIPADGTYSDGRFSFTPTTTVADAVDNLNEEAANFCLVADLSERDAIPSTARRVGQVVRLIDGARYVMGAGLTNSDWVRLNHDGYEFYTSNFNATFQPDINLYVETTGDDVNNTGRSVSSPFATLQRAFDEMPPGMTAAVLINIGPGSFAGGEVRITGAGQIFIDGYTYDLESVDVVTDNGFVTGKVSQKDIELTSFTTSIVEGTHFIKVPLPGFPLFDSSRILRSGTSPDVVIITNATTETFTGASIYTYGTNITSTITSLGVRPVITFCQFTGGTSTNVTFNSCKITGTTTALTSVEGFSINYVEPIIRFDKSAGGFNFNSCLIKGGMDLFNAVVPINRVDGVFAGAAALTLGGTTTASGSRPLFRIGSTDFEVTSDCIRLRNYTFLDQLASISCTGTGRFLNLEDGSYYNASSNSVTGTVTLPISLMDGAQLINGSGISLSNTADSGDDIIVGNGASANSFSELPVTDATSLCRATV